GILFAVDNDDPDKHGRRAGQDAGNKMATEIHQQYPTCKSKIALPPRKVTNGLKCDWLDIWNIDPAGTRRYLLSAPDFRPIETSTPGVRNSMRGMFAKRDQ